MFTVNYSIHLIDNALHSILYNGQSKMRVLIFLGEIVNQLSTHEINFIATNPLYILTVTFYIRFLCTIDR